MPTSHFGARPIRPLLFLVLVLAALLSADSSRQKAWAQGPISVFLPAVKLTPLGVSEPITPMDVVGYVVDRRGKGVGNVLIMVQADGWSASTTTGGDGSFRFTLTPGDFIIEPISLVAQPASFQVDGLHRVEVVFREVVVGTPFPRASPTPRPTLGPGTPTATATAATPTPTVTPPTATATRVTTTATPTTTPVPVSLLPPISLPLAPWLTPFVVGLAGGATLALLGGLVLLWRRR